MALAYQYQGDMLFKKRPQVIVKASSDESLSVADFTFQVRLGAIQSKAYLLNPRTLVWKHIHCRSWC